MLFRSQLKKVKKWLDPKTAIKEETGVAIAVPDVSFEGLEKIRRFLRDRSYGLPAEGYDAISQKQAGKLADSIENIMEEFSPGFKAYKDAYKEASKPINELKTKLGRSITDKPEGFDLGQYVMDASKLGAKVFDSKGTVQQLISVLGKDEAEQIAKGYIADALRKPTSTNLESFITKNRDWIDQFPNLSAKLRSAQSDIAKAEKMGAKGSKLEDLLRTKMGSLPKLRTEASRLEESAALDFPVTISKGEQKAGVLESAGEREAVKAESAGSKSAEQLIAEGETQISQSAKSVEKQAKKLEDEAAARIKSIETEATGKAKPLTEQAKKIRDEAQKRVDTI